MISWLRQIHTYTFRDILLLYLPPSLPARRRETCLTVLMSWCRIKRNFIQQKKVIESIFQCQLKTEEVEREYVKKLLFRVDLNFLICLLWVFGAHRHIGTSIRLLQHDATFNFNLFIKAKYTDGDIRVELRKVGRVENCDVAWFL